MTPAVKFLQKENVGNTVRRYEIGDSQEGTYGEAVARAIDAEPQRAFKTLIAQLNSGELVVAVVPVCETLDLRHRGRCEVCNDGTSTDSGEGD